MNKIISLILTTIFLFSFEVKSQKKSFYEQEIDKKKNIFSKSKERSAKDDYQYKSYFYSGLKYKALSNFERAIKDFENCIKLNHLEPSPYYEIGKIYFYQEEYEKSLEYSKKATELNSKNKWYLEIYAESLFNNHKFLQAEKAFKKLIKQNKKNEDYYIYLARLYVYTNNLKGAVKTYNDLEKIKGIHHFTTIQKYKLYLDMQEFNLAAKELEILLEKFPADIEIYEMLSDCYILNNDFDKAFKILKELSIIDPNSASVHFTLSDFYLQKGDVQMYLEELLLAFSSEKLDAQSKIKKFVPILQSTIENNTYDFNYVIMLGRTLVETHPEDEMINYIYADLLNSNKDFDLAIFHYKKVLKINKNQQDAWIEMLFLHLRIKNYDDLIIDSEEALEFFPTNSTIYYLNALAYYNSKEFLKTIESLNIGVNFIANNSSLASEMYSLLGEAYNEIEDYENSDKSFERSLDFLPNNALVLNNYAYYLSLRGEKLEKAEKMSKKTLEISPEEGNYYDTYAWILYKMKNYSKAKQFMIIAIEKGGDSSPVLLDHMSDILYELGEIEESKKYRNKSKELRDVAEKKDNINSDE